MKIIYRQTGGFAGLTKGCELDTSEMATAEKEEVQTIAGQAAVLGPTNAQSKQARDVIVHDIQIEQNGKTTQLVVDDVSTPPAVRPLLSFLEKRAKIVPRR